MEVTDSSEENTDKELFGKEWLDRALREGVSGEVTFKLRS